MQRDVTSERREAEVQRRLYLLYHELRPSGSSYSYVVDTEAFERHLELYAALRKRPDGELCPEITFDDGHGSNYQYALPRLEAKNLKAHFFITVGWTGVRAGYMGWEELHALRASGQIIGAHGWSHTLLTHCNSRQLDMELRVARLTLEEKLGVAVTTMSLPGGRYNSKVLTACRAAGYTQVYTSAPQAVTLPVGGLIGRLNIRGDMTVAWIESVLERNSPILRSLGRQYRAKEAAKRMLGDKVYAKLWSLLNHQEKDEIEAVAE